MMQQLSLEDYIESLKRFMPGVPIWIQKWAATEELSGLLSSYHSCPGASIAVVDEQAFFTDALYSSLRNYCFAYNIDFTRSVTNRQVVCPDCNIQFIWSEERAVGIRAACLLYRHPCNLELFRRMLY